MLLVTFGEELEGGEALDAEFGGNVSVLFLVAVDVGDEALLIDCFWLVRVWRIKGERHLGFGFKCCRNLI